MGTCYDLPPLIGTPKQRKVAERIRERKVPELKRLEAQLKADPPEGIDLEKALRSIDIAVNRRAPNWWTDISGLSAEEIMRKVDPSL
ncbi:MAG: hypothetical protein KAW17_05770 [Candidatus Eisenbacteria sp.]|nr:hypothetical protein [Candidatus Eisenbacteria bacterium]